MTRDVRLKGFSGG